MGHCGFLEEGAEVLKGTGLGEHWPHFLGLRLSPAISESTGWVKVELGLGEERRKNLAAVGGI